MTAVQVSPLQPGLTDDFEANHAGILARFPASSGKPDAKVVLPARANSAFELQDLGTGMHVEATLEGVQDKAAEMAHGFIGRRWVPIPRCCAAPCRTEVKTSSVSPYRQASSQ